MGSKVEINNVIESDECLKTLLDLEENASEIDYCTINPYNLEIKFSEQLDHSYYSTKNKPQGSERIQKNNYQKTIVQNQIQQEKKLKELHKNQEKIRRALLNIHFDKLKQKI